MSCLRIHLWREWRQHRRSLGLLVLFNVLLLGLALLGIPKGRVFYPEVVFLGAFTSLGMAALVVGADLFPSERNQGTETFLHRLPGGLASAFWAKLSFLGLLSVGSLVVGASLGLGLCFLRGDASVLGALHDQAHLQYALFALLLSSAAVLCIFAVSSWLKSASLGLPAAALFLLCVGLPGWVMQRRVHGGFVEHALVWWTLCLFLLGAVACAYVSFVIGIRRARWRPLWTSLSVLMASLAFAPSWVWAGQNYLDRNRSQLSVRNVKVGERQRFAFINLQRRPVHHWADTQVWSSTAVRLDLQSGRAQLAGRLDDSQWSGGQEWGWLGPISRKAGWPMVLLQNGLYFEKGSLVAVNPQRSIAFDAQSGEPLEGGTDVLRREALDRFGVPAEILRESEFLYLSSMGTGFGLECSEPGVSSDLLWDPATGLIVNHAALKAGQDSAAPGPYRRKYENVFVQPGRWLAKTPAGAYEWLDPVTQAAEPVPSMGKGFELEAQFDDGSLLHRKEHRLHRLWPSSGREQECRLIGFEGIDLERASWHKGYSLLSSQAKSVFTLRLNGELPLQGLALFDPWDTSLRLLHMAPLHGNGCFSIQATGDGYALLQEGAGRLHWFDPEQGELRLLFDVERSGLDLNPKGDL